MQKESGKLIVVRHQESEWNKLGLWTGIRDVALTPHGVHKSSEAGKCIRDLSFAHAFTSMQVRTIQTLSELLNICMTEEQKKHINIIHTPALNERDYGAYTGKNKLEVEKEIGEEAFVQLRRSWDYLVPYGETLKMVYARAVPFYTTHILPILLAGENVLVVSHGNTIRALTKYIEHISDAGIADIEMLFEEVVIYTVDTEGNNTSKTIRKI